MHSKFQKRSPKQAFLRFGYFLRFRSYADSCSFNVKVFQKRDSRNRCVNYIALD